MDPARRMFVTGGNGFLGSALVRRLCAEGWIVRCLLRPGSDTRRIEDLPIERVSGDLSSTSFLAEAMQGCQGVLHLASISSWDQIDSPALKSVVIEGTARVLAAARQSGNLRLVYVSSAAAIDGTQAPCVLDEEAPFSLDEKRFPYAVAKHLAEQLVLQVVEEGLPAVIVNPSEVYGPEDERLVTASNLLNFLKPGPVLVCRGGTGIVHREDVVSGILAAYERGKVGERYILSSENLSLRELARLTLDLAGFPMRRIIDVPNAPLRWAASVSKFLNTPFPVPPALIPYATTYWFVSADKARREFGIEFRSPPDIIQPTLDWLRASAHWPGADADERTQGLAK